jgi:hypothetical protein
MLTTHIDRQKPEEPCTNTLPSSRAYLRSRLF